MPTGGFNTYPVPRKRWRYPGVEVPFRLESKYWDYSKGDDPRARQWRKRNG